MTEIENLQEALAHAELLRDQLRKEIKAAKVTITRGEFFLETAEKNVADLREKLNRAKKNEQPRTDGSTYL